MGVPEASLEQTEAGLAPRQPGWFVLNVADVVWERNDKVGQWTKFEGKWGEFEHYGIGIHVLQPGQPNGIYHSEALQESFLVLSGECLLLIEEEERRLRAWDFVHCPAGTRHIFVGAGEAPCAILMVGARGDNKLHYPRSELARRYGVETPEETDLPREAYRDWPREFVPVRGSWPV
jgi:uncharacterized cupin superfamily protein